MGSRALSRRLGVLVCVFVSSLVFSGSPARAEDEVEFMGEILGRQIMCRISPDGSTRLEVPGPRPMGIEDLERVVRTRVRALTRGNKRRAARALRLRAEAVFDSVRAGCQPRPAPTPPPATATPTPRPTLPPRDPETAPLSLFFIEGYTVGRHDLRTNQTQREIVRGAANPFLALAQPQFGSVTGSLYFRAPWTGRIARLAPGAQAPETFSLDPQPLQILSFAVREDQQSIFFISNDRILRRYSLTTRASSVVSQSPVASAQDFNQVSEFSDLIVDTQRSAVFLSTSSKVMRYDITTGVSSEIYSDPQGFAIRSIAQDADGSILVLNGNTGLYRVPNVGGDASVVIARGQLPGGFGLVLMSIVRRPVSNSYLLLYQGGIVEVSSAGAVIANTSLSEQVYSAFDLAVSADGTRRAISVNYPGRLLEVSANGSLVDLIEPARLPTALAVDNQSDRLYVYDAGSSSLKAASFSGTGVSTVRNLRVSEPVGGIVLSPEWGLIASSDGLLRISPDGAVSERIQLEEGHFIPIGKISYSRSGGVISSYWLMEAGGLMPRTTFGGFGISEVRLPGLSGRNLFAFAQPMLAGQVIPSDVERDEATGTWYMIGLDIRSWTYDLYRVASRGGSPERIIGLSGEGSIGDIAISQRLRALFYSRGGSVWRYDLATGASSGPVLSAQSFPLGDMVIAETVP